MRNLTTTICLTLALLLGSAGVSWSADFQKGITAYKSKDYKTALREWKPLAEQGDADAQRNLGLIYVLGQGVIQDYDEAAKWYSKAAEQGDPVAQYNLGLMYVRGQGVIQDLVYAHMWFNLAASTGLAEAVKDRGVAAKRMTSADISKAQELARECVRKNYKGC